MWIKSRRWNLRTYLAFFVCAAVILIAIVTALLLNTTSRNALDRFRDQQVLLTEETAAGVGEYVSSLLGTFANVAVFADSSDHSSAILPAAIKGLYEREQGKLVCALRLSKTADIAFRYPAELNGWRLDAAQKQLLMQSTAPVLITSTNSKDLAILAPVRNEGRFDGAIGGLIDLSYIERAFLQRLADTRVCEVFVFNERGVLLTQVSSSFVNSAKYSTEVALSGLSDIIGKMTSGDSGFAPYEVVIKKDGKKLRQEMVMAYAPVHLPQGRWVLGIATPRSEAAGHFVQSPATVITFASSRVIALVVCVVLFLMFDKRRVAALVDAERLRENQKWVTRLEESEERYKTLVQNLLSPVIIFQDLRIKFGNPVFYSLAGYTPEEVAREDFDLFSLIHEDDRQVAMEDTSKLLNGETIEQPREVRFVKKSGEEVTGLSFSSLIHFEGNPAIECVVVDITQMKNMERELSSTKRRLQYLLDAAPIMIFSLDEMGRFSYANKETLRATGYQSDDWIGKPFAPIVHEDDLALAVAKFEEGRKGSPRRDYKLRIRNAEGELRVLHIVAGTILDDEQFAGSLIIARDVTEQHRLMLAVKETRDRLANIIGNAGDAIITLDNDSRIVSWNKSAETMFHFVEPTTFRNPLHSALNTDEAQLAGLINRVVCGESIRDVVIACEREGKQLDTLFTFSPIRDASGNVVGISCFAKDITERRRLEKQLERDKKFIDQLIENANALIAVSNEKSRIVIFNRRFEEVTGFQKEEALGKDPLTLLVPEDYRKIVAEKVTALTSDKPLFEFEVPIISKEGKTLMVAWNVSAVKLPSGNDAVVVVGRDVTEQKRMYEELTQSKKLASIGELVSGVAHELNNPLTIVMGYSQLLSVEQKLSEKQRDMAQKILEAAARSKRIVENLLAFARKKKLQKHEVNMNEIIESTLSLREHNLTVNNVKIVRNYDEKLPTTYADGHQLQQVFLNLINNAFDAMFMAHNGGTLEVKTYARNGSIMVEVADDGPGIPETNHDKIFDPFFTTKEVGKGTGLGMSLSYGIVKEHGGRIYLDKAYRTGARFIIEFPVTSTPAAVNAGAASGRGL